MRGVRGVRVSAEVVNSVAVGDWMGDPDVTLGWGRVGVRDGEKYAVGAELRWSRLEEIEPGEVGRVGMGDSAGEPAILAAHPSDTAHHASSLFWKCTQYVWRMLLTQ